MSEKSPFDQISIPAEEILEEQSTNSSEVPVLEYETPQKKVLGLFEKYPRLKKTLIVFVAVAGSYLANLGLKNSAPTLNAQGTKVEQVVDDLDKALSMIQDQEFVNEVKQLREGIENFVPNVPANSRYALQEYTETVNNNGVKISSEAKGELPDQAENVVVGIDQLLKNLTKETSDSEKGDAMNDYSGLAESFYIANPNEGTTIEAAGTMTHQGEGATKEKALVSALQAAVQFMGNSIEAEDTSVKKTEVAHGEGEKDKASMSDVLRESTKTGAKQAIKGYRILNHDIDMEHQTHKVKVEVQYGVEQPNK